MEELKALLTYSEKLNPMLKTIITISVRHVGSKRMIRYLMEVAEKHENVGLNLVAGNKVYLTAREQERSAVKTITKAIKFVKKNWKDAMVFVGTEGLLKTVSRLVYEYDVTPFLLLDRNLEADISRIRERNGKCSIAVYAPYFVFAEGCDASYDVISRLLDYALRRSWVQESLTKEGYDPKRILELFQKDPSHIKHQNLKEILKSITQKLSIFGDEQTISQTLQTLKEVSIIAGLPIKEEERQIKEFARIIQKLNGF
jgi:uncharacterized FAD-dependent dehydrogenase